MTPNLANDWTKFQQNTSLCNTKKLSSTAKKAHLMMSDEVHDYSEIYTPSTAEPKAVIASAASEAADYYGTSTASMSASEQSSRLPLQILNYNSCIQIRAQ